MKQLRFAHALFGTSIHASLSLRSAFLLQLCFMAVNNLMVFVTWWILFDRFDNIRGYRLPDMLCMFGIGAAGFGLAAVLFGGAPELSRKIVDGELDALLTQPKSVLLRALGARSNAAGWGDIASGLLMLAWSGQLTLGKLPLALLAIALAAVVLTSSAVLMHSTAFWLGNVESAARVAHDFVVAFTLYPPSLFGAGLKTVLFTLLPAGLVVYLPVELLRDFSVRTVGLAVGGAGLHVLLSGMVFHRGLRRYESGSRIGVWG
jgi:ABC-2 type transport system permease protein